jgi:RNA polymerase sigma-70 factor, ECF subfamily
MSAGRTISEWFSTYSDDVNNFLVYYTGMYDVEDLVQEVFLKALKGINNFKGDAEPKTWLFSIARNVAKDEFRKRKIKTSKDVHLSGNVLEIKDEHSPEKIAQWKETNKELYQAIQSLKGNYRDVVILRGIQQLSIKETSTILQWSESKVKTTYYRALQILRKGRRASL